MDPARKRERSPEGRRQPDQKLDRIVDRVREDARKSPAEYLRQSEVPAGGE